MASDHADGPGKGHELLDQARTENLANGTPSRVPFSFAACILLPRQTVICIADIQAVKIAGLEKTEFPWIMAQIESFQAAIHPAPPPATVRPS
ncbi:MULTISPECIES: hypothetical protein [Thalassospira]|uniref:hypothetical protein n=1 Tax=Thalassospira TaxID=168934 RepID=UPI002942C17A|nr:hypothetical protein [Thalassospira lucentensis]WOI13212.1 hypothetical protein R1T41_15415 [Thalassospira lucentensis]